VLLLLLLLVASLLLFWPGCQTADQEQIILVSDKHAAAVAVAADLGKPLLSRIQPTNQPTNTPSHFVKPHHAL
jgi:hypothetical protein